jgi:FkbM family methyltransferase
LGGGKQAITEMNVTIRRILTANRLSQRLYCSAREAYHRRRVARGAARYFVNADEFKDALGAHRVTALDLRTVDGLTITIRQNYSDAMTVAEIFLDHCYAHDLTLSANPVVIDIGGFIGDFSLYAVKRLNARRVIVCEPSPRNWALLLKNIQNNGYEDRIEPLNKAVTADGGSVMLNIDAPDDCQNMVSAYCSSEQPLTSVPGISLSQLLEDYVVEDVDLLKIDVEGGEYAILESTPSSVFSRIRNIVFEYHDIDGGWAKLESVKQRLRREGYVLRMRPGLVSASRS